MDTLKKLWHSTPGSKKPNPYADPFNPNNVINIRPYASTQHLPTSSTPPYPAIRPTSPRGSFDYLAEARRAVGRDPVTGRRVVTTSPGDAPLIAYAPSWNEGNEVDEADPVQDGRVQATREVGKKESRGRMWAQGMKKRKWIPRKGKEVVSVPEPSAVDEPTGGTTARVPNPALGGYYAPPPRQVKEYYAPGAPQR